MANCRDCGIKVGCGCQLINGLCSACNNKLKNATNRIKDVITKINRLCSNVLAFLLTLTDIDVRLTDTGQIASTTILYSL